MFCRLFESASPFVILFFKKNVYHSCLQNDLKKSDECTDLYIVNPKDRILPCVGKVATVVLNDSSPLSFTGMPIDTRYSGKMDGFLGISVSQSDFLELIFTIFIDFIILTTLL